MLGLVFNQGMIWYMPLFFKQERINFAEDKLCKAKLARVVCLIPVLNSELFVFHVGLQLYCRVTVQPFSEKKKGLCSKL